MNRVTRLAYFIFILYLISIGSLFAQEFAGGSGTETDPWQIETAEHLNNIRNYLGSGHSDKHFIQISDIDLFDATREGGTYWNEGSGWLPIGDASTYFTGKYNGQGYNIPGIYINRSHATIGLFGRTSGAVIKNLGLTNTDITGTEYVGGIIGYNANSEIENCFVRGNVTGTQYVGGLIGTHRNESILTNCYSTGSVTGNSNVGGLIGHALSAEINSSYSKAGVIAAEFDGGGLVGSNISGTITNCYSTGSVIGPSDIGGLVGYNNLGTITHCYSTGLVVGSSNVGGLVGNFISYGGNHDINNYWNTITSEQAASAMGNGRTTTEMTFPYAANTYVDWDFTEAWTVDTFPFNYGYPFLRWQWEVPNATEPLAGDGSSYAPYQIATLENLYWIAENPERWVYHYIQTADIDASETLNWFGGEGWTPIGNGSILFYGSYNGQNHVIDGLYINRPETNYIGLFGSLNGAVIKNLNLINADITGASDVGGIAGYAMNNSSLLQVSCKGVLAGTGTYGLGGLVGIVDESSLDNSYSEVYLEGNDFVGGLVGFNHNNSSIMSCYSNSVVVGNSQVGILAGRSTYGSSIDNCYSAGLATGAFYVGGLVGELYQDCLVNNSYSSGIVSGDQDTGGLVGSSYYSTVSSSYWNTETSYQNSSAGGEERTTAEMTYPYAPNTYVDWDFTDTWRADEDYGNNDGYPYLKFQLQFLIPITQEPVAGDGTIGNPYQIASLKNLCWIAESDERWGDHYIQTADIDASETADWYWGQGWLPIGNETSSFTGSYDGEGHTITGLEIRRYETDYIGLFGAASGATIQNLGFIDIYVSGGSYVGGLAGKLINTDVTDCYIAGYVAGYSYVGGLVGTNTENSSLINNYSSGDLHGVEIVGGLAGSNSYSSIGDCYSTAQIEAYGHLGGLIGLNDNSIINNSYSTGNILAWGWYSGGLAGENSNNSTISNCYHSSGSVTGFSYIGGLTGDNNNNSFIVNSYSTVYVSGGFSNAIGGLSGGNSSNSMIVKCYSTGMISGLGGGLIGVSDLSATVYHSYWNMDTSGKETSAGGEGRTTAEMTYPYAANTYLYWEFTDIWGVDNFAFNNGYPFLQWQLQFELPPSEFPSAGDGTETNPYQIATLKNLFWIAESSERWGDHYIQIEDINASSTSVWFEGEGWIPIGNGSAAFTGTYNGQEHIIDGLYVNRPATDYIGLFGVVNSAVIQNLSVINVDISGNDYVGGLIGYHLESELNNSSATGSISGNDFVGGLIGHLYLWSAVNKCYSDGFVEGHNEVGGLIGFNDYGSTVTNSYSNSNVIGNWYVGGLIGDNYYMSNSLSNSYSTGSVTGDNRVGGLVGFNNDASITNCFSKGSVTGNTNAGGLIGYGYYEYSSVINSYWDMNSSGQSTSSGGEGRSTPDMTFPYATNTYVDWDFTEIWYEDIIDYNNGYPYLQWQWELPPAEEPLVGDGTEGNPYQIATLENLYWITENSARWGYHYIQIADIDATETIDWLGGEGWIPIGNSSPWFTGVYDGQGHFIDGLYIDRQDTDYIGLFGRTSGATIQNLGLTNLDFNGWSYIGGLVGYNYNSTVNDCNSTGNVSGTNILIGGLIGRNQLSTIINSYSSGAVSGNANIGGLVGANYNNSVVSNSYSSSDVSGNNYIGGLAGISELSSSISQSYSTGAVSGLEPHTGGLVGRNQESAIVHCYSTGYVTSTSDIAGFAGSIGTGGSYADTNNYWDMDTSGKEESAMGQGQTTSEMTYPYDTATYVSWDFIDNWSADPINLNYGYPYLQWQWDTPSSEEPLLGDGTIGNPYQIATLENLYWIAEYSGRWGYQYIQTADIDASETMSWFEGAGWIPIGNSTTYFTGTYNGQDHTIDRLYTYRPTTDYIGLFGYVRSTTAEITNLGLTNLNITGGSNVGGLAGTNWSSTIVSNCYTTGIIVGVDTVGGLIGANNYSSVNESYSKAIVSGGDSCGGLAALNFSSLISKSYASGNVSSTGNFIGGLVGYSYGSSTISSCFSMGRVIGVQDVGSLTGYNAQSVVENCYATGLVTGSINVGGLTGGITTGGGFADTNNYWNTETTNQTFSHMGEGRTTSEMTYPYDIDTYQNWDFINTWKEDIPYLNKGYPYLQWQWELPLSEEPLVGDGTESNPYQIANLANLFWITENTDRWGYHYVQVADIDASPSVNWFGGLGWKPIGNNSYSFTGAYNGQGHTIDGLYINRPDESGLGLFGYTEEAVIANLGLINADITGYASTAILAGRSLEGTVITNCYATGIVTGLYQVTAGLVGLLDQESSVIDGYTDVVVNGWEMVGGLVALSHSDCVISNCNTTGSVNGHNTVGGLVGTMHSGTIIDSFSSANITATGNSTGGFAGRIDQYCSVINCYSTGNVSGTNSIGGFAGYLWAVGIENSLFDKCYSTGLVIGEQYVGGFIGYSESNTMSNCFSSGSVTGDQFVGGLIGYGNYTTIINCHSKGNVEGNNYTGGFVGRQYYSHLNDSFSSGNVSGDQYVGGFIGYKLGISTLNNCYSLGNVEGNQYVGGLAGYNTSDISNSYSKGIVSGNSYVGGLIGYNTSGGIVSSCYYNSETSGQSDTGKGEPRTSAEMTYPYDIDTYEGWNFSDIWNEDLPYLNKGYPYLQWQWELPSSTEPLTGDGTEGNPYQIASLEDLFWIVESSERWSYHYIQTADIDASETVSWFGGAGWSPIGTISPRFSGSYNGQNHRIEGLYINRPGADYIGLFGATNGTVINNLNLINVNITGNEYVGSLVGYHSVSQSVNIMSTGVISGENYVGGVIGYLNFTDLSQSFSLSGVNGVLYVGGLAGRVNSSEVNNSYSEGEVIGEQYVGGLAGYIYVSGVTDCYSTATVNGNLSVGGLVGHNYRSPIEHCYSKGMVSGETNIGGLVGYRVTSGAYADINNYWDTETSGQANSIMGYGRTTAEMTYPYAVNTYEDWDFTDIWFADQNFLINDGYPCLQWHWELPESIEPLAGNGTEGNPYEIENLANLYWIAEDNTRWGYHYIQTADIDASDTNYWFGGLGWTPVGDMSTNFTGSYDGQGFLIDGLHINRPVTNIVGLFGFTEGSTLQNLGLTNVDLTGNDVVGGLVAYHLDDSSISNSFCTGNINGNNYVGGLVGVQSNAAVNNSFSSATIMGNSYVGGLIAGQSNSTITRCFSTGTVSGLSYIGGLAGFTDSSYIYNSFSAGTVNGESYNAGFVSWNQMSAIVHCYSIAEVNGVEYNGGFTATIDTGGLYEDTNNYWNTETSGQNFSSMGIGKTTAEMTYPYDADTYLDWDFVNTWFEDIAFIKDGYPFLQWQTDYMNILPPVNLAAEVVDGAVNLSWNLLGETGRNSELNRVRTKDPEIKEKEVIFNEITQVSSRQRTVEKSRMNSERSLLGYNIFKDNEQINQELVLSQQYIDADVIMGNSYTYFVTTVYSDGESEPSEPLSVTIFQISVPPDIGDGTEMNPYEIATLENLYWIAENSERWGYYYIQIAYIDASYTSEWFDGLGWSPIGSSSTYFTGSYNGQDHTIDGLFVNRMGSAYIGLFGFVNNANIQNIGMTDVNLGGMSYVGSIAGANTSSTISNCQSSGNLSGEVYIGGITGYNDGGTVNNCFNRASVSGTGLYPRVGGIAGYHASYSTISNCYNIGSITASDYTGGLVGITHLSYIDNSYNFGNISGDDSIGGLVGSNYQSSIIHCYSKGQVNGISNTGGLAGTITTGGLYADTNNYWDIDTSGQTTSALGEGRTSSEMRYPYDTNTYVDWDFIAIWSADENYLLNNGYPYLTELVPSQSEFAGGSGTLEDPWQIATPYNLNNVRNYLGPENSNKYFIQIADIDLSVSPWNEGEGWVSIGYSIEAEQFTASYDGQEHFINGLYINRSGTNIQGLFGYTNGAVIENLRMTNIGITGGSMVGGIAGFLRDSTLSKSSVEGLISGESQVGGIIGYNHQSNLSNCFSRGTITASGNIVGGLIGYNTGALVNNCYSKASINGNWYVGGLVGNNNQSAIENSYSMGAVTGNSQVGGFVGGIMTGGIFADINNYWDMDTSGLINSAMGNGRTTEEMTYPYDINTYVDWDFTDIWFGDVTNNNDGYPFLQWEVDYIYVLPPINLTATTGSNVIYLSWEGPVYATPLGYNVYRNGSQINSSLVTDLQYPDNNVTNGVTYNYYVTAVYSAGESEPSNSIEATPSLFAGGNGTESNPWQIATAGQLYNVRNYTGETHSDKYFIQIAHINLGELPWNDGEGWLPIGSSTPANRFFAHYNGNGYTINGMFINRTTGYQGLFAYTQNATLIEITLSDFNITATTNIGGLVGYAVATTIDKCHLNGSVTASSNNIGGLAGRVENGSIVTDSHYSGNVSGLNYVGGLIGYLTFPLSSVTNCYTTGNVTGTGPGSYGGLIGYNMSSVISNCYSESEVSGVSSVGGLVGYHVGYVNQPFGLIESCYSIGNVVGSGNNVGGLVGYTNERSSITNSYSRGNADGVQRVGGLVGYHSSGGEIINCFSTGIPTGSINGGLVGQGILYIDYYSYWDTETSGINTSPFGIGRTTEEMTYPYDLDTYVYWDFAEIWAADIGYEFNDGYPYLQWQGASSGLLSPENLAIIISGGYIYLNWDAVSGANSYKIYVSDDPNSQNWEDPVAIVGEPGYSEEITENKRFYRLTASTDNPPVLRRYIPGRRVGMSGASKE